MTTVASSPVYVPLTTTPLPTTAPAAGDVITVVGLITLIWMAADVPLFC
jgi:hypothetical protein